MYTGVHVGAPLGLTSLCSVGLDAGVDQLGTFYISLGQDLEKSINAQALSNQMTKHKVNLLRRN
jgi:hypothetical protein